MVVVSPLLRSIAGVTPVTVPLRPTVSTPIWPLVPVPTEALKVTFAPPMFSSCALIVVPEAKVVVPGPANTEKLYGESSAFTVPLKVTDPPPVVTPVGATLLNWALFSSRMLLL